MPVSISSLHDELTNDPNSLYAGLEPAQIAKVINDPMENSAFRVQRVPRRAAKTLLLQRGKLLNIVRPKKEGKPAEEVSLLDQVEFIMSDPDFQDIDFSSPESVAMLNALVGLNYLTVADVAAVQALGRVPISRAQELFGESVTDDQIILALAAE